jgi:hypothetical protein
LLNFVVKLVKSGRKRGRKDLAGKEDGRAGWAGGKAAQEEKRGGRRDGTEKWWRMWAWEKDAVD